MEVEEGSRKAFSKCITKALLDFLHSSNPIRKLSADPHDSPCRFREAYEGVPQFRFLIPNIGFRALVNVSYACEYEMQSLYHYSPIGRLAGNSCEPLVKGLVAYI